MARILMVDDEPHIREEAVEVLTRDGHDVLQAADGHEAMKIIRTRSVELVITDIIMPKMNGLDVIREVRRDFGHIRDVRIIAISSGGGMSDPDVLLGHSQRFGADYLLMKPFSPDELRAAIADVLARPSDEAEPEPAALG